MRCRSPRRSLACIMSLLHNSFFKHYISPSCSYMVVGPSPLFADLFSTHFQVELDKSMRIDSQCKRKTSDHGPGPANIVLG